MMARFSSTPYIILPSNSLVLILLPNGNIKVLLQTQIILSKIRSPAHISSFTDKVFWPPFPRRCDP